MFDYIDKMLSEIMLLISSIERAECLHGDNEQYERDQLRAAWSALYSVKSRLGPKVMQELVEKRLRGE